MIWYSLETGRYYVSEDRPLGKHITSYSSFRRASEAYVLVIHPKLF